MSMTLVDYATIGKTVFNSKQFMITNKGDTSGGLIGIKNHLHETAQVSIAACDIPVSIAACDINGNLVVEPINVKVYYRTNGAVTLNVAPLMEWFETTFIYSYIKAYMGSYVTYPKKEVVSLAENPEQASRKDEIVDIFYDDSLPSLIFKPRFVITPDNACQYLRDDELQLFLQYLFQNIHSLKMSHSADSVYLGKKISFLAQNGATAWMTAEEYAKKGYDGPGIYTARKRKENGQTDYYIGKAISILKRVQCDNSGSSLRHPESNDPNFNGCFDEIRFDAISFNELFKLIKDYHKAMSRFAGNPQQEKKCQDAMKDSVLYALEGLLINAIGMIALEEKSLTLSNSQFDKASPSELKKSGK